MGPMATYPMPGKENKAGALLAIDVRTMEIKWRVEQQLFLSGAVSTMAGCCLSVISTDVFRHWMDGAVTLVHATARGSRRDYLRGRR